MVSISRRTAREFAARRTEWASTNLRASASVMPDYYQPHRPPCSPGLLGLARNLEHRDPAVQIAPMRPRIHDHGIESLADLAQSQGPWVAAADCCTRA